VPQGSDDVRSRFAPVAANYVSSEFHAGAERLQEVVELCRPAPEDSVLDVATGTGNTALALAPHARLVVGLDLTSEMLAQARRVAAERGVDNVDWVLGDAQSLPFCDGSFDLYTVRAASHHFADLAGTLREARRVLREGGRAALIDCSAPPAARDLLHEVELRRDPSHVRSYTLDEWRDAVEAAGFDIELADRRELDWDFEPWMRRMAVPEGEIQALSALIEQSTGEAHAQLRPGRREGRLWHAYWHALIRARRR
jgi:ubiquinone/menaquinone biosynthesis C-methylase UbiE